MEYTSSKLLHQIFTPRPAISRKYDYGHLLIIAGSKFYPGASGLASLAALRSGVDVVTLAAPKRAADIAAGFSPALITYSLAGDFLMERHFDEILTLLKGKNAIALGPGLGREEETLEIVRQIVKSTDLPTVIDADAIYAFGKKQDTRNKKQTIFTPHAREFKALTDIDVTALEINAKTEVVKKTAKKLGAVILLKGPTDIISDGTEVYLNKTGSPYMTSGGTGDVLCGMVGALAARLHAQAIYNGQTVDLAKISYTAACAGAYLSGKAGELAAKKYKDSLIATDVIEEIRRVIVR
ncbi:MAG: NAD(P)H-hydrate dehydratase [Candidatus Jacksonbacteria bacterium RIFOXYC2_FULL_44_29]|nr:MAG: putative sugar kinase, YjeF-related protein [Parcubacteria group bacterium GW2011_GWA2_42_28]KKT55875.1 MAG: putative sugar kinase, YjeF-related protein [Parcubacteria group bacterium GW2011_GWC2_44_22]OGY74491.1 MAG: NAD(P)H-hydrate dehydratase [Candidatus Jacksonbacteria bacterium RIFOXYA2_FULL_43_12]OGY77400.1 MAG: NAD(P)H-hydrate dehydratase [Candidatus Jacksonbacteria bacterium RIFOXYB2_FULL_44_15]OGY78171.1 MAG: NAD(P)H-hydrate dehydratase [Candidatus Jacksonbacteria bacterium RIF